MHPSRPSKGLSRLLLKWPARRRELVAAHESCSQFRTLCELYDDAVTALEGWRRSQNDVAAERVVEYEELGRELEADLQALLAAKITR